MDILCVRLRSKVARSYPEIRLLRVCRVGFLNWLILLDWGGALVSVAAHGHDGSFWAAAVGTMNSHTREGGWQEEDEERWQRYQLTGEALSQEEAFRHFDKLREKK